MMTQMRKRRGVFNPQGARNTEEVIITESVIDAAALWSAGCGKSFLFTV
jgi:hypothetical protein